MQTLSNNSEYEYAGFWVRFAAYIIDSIIISAGLLIVKLFFGIVSLIGPEFLSTAFDSAILFQYSLRDIILYLASAAYFVLLTYYTGTTLGKHVMNLRVISTKEVAQPSFADLLYRETIGRFLSGILCIGYILAGVDREKRALHDILCDTRVIYAKKVKVYTTTIPVTMPNTPYTPGKTYTSASINPESIVDNTVDNTTEKDGPF